MLDPGGSDEGKRCAHRRPTRARPPTPARRAARRRRRRARSAAIRIKGNDLAAHHQRLEPVAGTTARSAPTSILTAIWHMLRTGQTYTDLGGDYFTRRHPQRQTRRLVAQLERLGHTLTLQEGPGES